MSLMTYLETPSDERQNVALNVGGPGYPLGSYISGTLVESRAELAAGMAKLLESDKYVELTKKGQQFQTGPGDDRLRHVIHIAGFDPSEGNKIGSTAVAVTSEIVNGQSAAATHHSAPTIRGFEGVNVCSQANSAVML